MPSVLIESCHVQGRVPLIVAILSALDETDPEAEDVAEVNALAEFARHHVGESLFAEYVS